MVPHFRMPLTLPQVHSMHAGLLSAYLGATELRRGLFVRREDLGVVGQGCR